MDLPGPRWKKGKDGKDFSALAAANPMLVIVAELKASFISSKPVAILSGPGGGAILGVEPKQAVILNSAAFGHAVEIVAAQKHWFQLSPEEVFYLCHDLNCIRVESRDKNLDGLIIYVAWGIWLQRNARIFNNAYGTVAQVVASVINMCKAFVDAQNG